MCTWDLPHPLGIQKILLLENDVGSSWVLDNTKLSPSLFSEMIGILNLPCRCLHFITPSNSLFSSPPKSNTEIQGPKTMFSSFLFGHSLSFCFMDLKATDSSTKERQWVAPHWLGPNTKYNCPPSPVSVLHTLKTGDLAETFTLQITSILRGRGLTPQNFRMRKPKSQEPSAQSREVEAGIGFVNVSVCVFVCVCMPVPSSCSPD